MSPITSITKIFRGLYVFSWDFSLTLLNFLLPKRKIGSVTPAGQPGAGGKWPEYVAPKDGDSRCSCPALNALANHGILPHDGKNISFVELNRVIRASYNFAPSFCYFVPNHAADMMKKNYKTDRFDLVELDLHSSDSIEHDASLLRRDMYFERDQAKIHVPYVKELLESATGKDDSGNPLLTIPDLSLISSKRRAESRAENPEFELNKSHQIFGSSNSSTLLTIFGGRIRDLETVLLEERLPDQWESRIREPYGLTLFTFNKTVFKVEGKIDESKFPQTAPAKIVEPTTSV